MFRAILLTVAMVTMLAPRPSKGAEASAARGRIGDVYEITRTLDSVSHGNNGSSGSSHDVDSIIERVIVARPDGWELEYDLPKATTAEGRAGNWQFPVRLFEPVRGPLQLLNGPELEARIDPWLKANGMTRAVCGHWIFTWNGFRIDCDPQSVVAGVQAFHLRSTSLRDGDSYQDDDALAPGRLARNAAGPTGTTFSVALEVDPKRVRQARAETDVAVAEIMRKPTTLDAALRERAKDIISGTISITFSTDSAGNILGRSKVVELETKEPSGKTEWKTTTEAVERRLVSGRRQGRP